MAKLTDLIPFLNKESCMGGNSYSIKSYSQKLTFKGQPVRFVDICADNENVALIYLENSTSPDYSIHNLTELDTFSLV